MTARGKDKTKIPGKPGPVTDEAFRVVAALHGFDIAGFDEWLAKMKPCGANEELTERRRLAKEAIKRGEPINTDALLRHLEWMLLRWCYIRRSEYILPLARTGDKHRKASARGARNRPPPAWHGRCVDRARGLIANGMAPRNVPSVLVEAFGKDRTTIKRILRKAGVM